MARIIFQNDIYQEVSLKMFHESEVQAALASRASSIFNGYYYSLFNAMVQTEDDSAKPDFVLVEHDYRKWYVGEVEMIRHDLINHVLRQVRVFNRAIYSEEHAKYIAEHRPDIDYQRLRLLVEAVKPTVIVVADKMDETWKDILHSEGIKLSIFELFRRQDSADLIFRINGDAPEIPDELLTYCEFDKSIKRLLKLNTPSSLPVAHGESIDLEIDGVLSKWVYMVAEDKAWLNPVGYVDLPPQSKYMIKRTFEGKFILEEKPNEAQRRT